MATLLRILVVSIVLTALVSTILYFNTTDRNCFGKMVLGQATYDNVNNQLYVIDTPSCRIPNFDPFQKSTLRLVQPSLNILCNQEISLTYQIGNFIHVNWTAIAETNFTIPFSHCVYDPIYRPLTGTGHNFFSYLNQDKTFNSSIEVKEEFIRVRCFNKMADTVFKNFYAFAVEKQHIKSRLQEVMKTQGMTKKLKEKPNVLMISTDSVSRLHSLRKLSSTRQYLMQELGAFEFLGYNKVGLNTFPNFVPMFSGKHVQELLGKTKMTHQITFDKYDFIWKTFSNNGYRTFFAEDVPSIGTFDYVKGGFQEIPTDYYYRLLSVAMNREPNVWNNNKMCIVNRTETDVILDYLFQIVSKFRRDPFFAVTHLSGFSHDSLKTVVTLDAKYLKFIKRLEENGYLDNTILFFISDHGMRFGSFRQTYIGGFEDKLPFMLISLPKAMRTKYPYLTRNLQINTERLVTTFDIYETLMEIIDFTGVEKPVSGIPRGVSLFNKIPETRNCSSAGIPIEYCACVEYKNSSISDLSAKIAANKVVSHLNRLLGNYIMICHVLEVGEIISMMEINNDQMAQVGKTKKRKYNIRLKLRTKPGDGIFEAVFEYDKVRQTYKIISEIERVNRYGDQSHCISDIQLKNYCLCKS